MQDDSAASRGCNSGTGRSYCGELAISSACLPLTCCMEDTMLLGKHLVFTFEELRFCIGDRYVSNSTRGRTA